MTRKRMAVLLAATATFMAIGLGSAFAHAMTIWDNDPPQTYWADEHKLCQSGYCSSGTSVGTVVAVWQNILYADGIATRCGSSGIDGVFGSNTRAYTISWQNQHGLSADGVVGPGTWGTADQYVYPVNGSAIYWYYDAAYSYTRDIDFFQSGGNGYIYWKSPITNTWWYTDHGSSATSC